MFFLRALSEGSALLTRQAKRTMLAGGPPSSAQHLFLSSSSVLGAVSINRSFAAAMTTKSDSPGYDAHIEAVFEKKRTLRTQIRKALRCMSPAQRAKEDKAIQSIVLEAPWFKSSHCICAYVNCDALREVDTSSILSDLMAVHTKENCTQNRKRLYLPRIEDRNSNMKMLHVSSYDDLIPNSMNIFEPSPLGLDGNQREDAMKADEPVDLFILPGLAFDRAGNRLGRSGGYYDVYLKKYWDVAKERRWKKPLHVGLAYSVQLVDDGAIAVTSDDIPVDAVVTPSGFIQISTP
ncbi:hypothetical protein V2J09_013065 [Rumex salicifolius]